MSASVLFVCMGNICRSPAGEGVLQALVDDCGLSARVRVASAGTIGYHEGKPADARMRAAAARRGYDLRRNARRIRSEDLQAFDLIIAMDSENYRDLERLDPSPAAELRLLSDFLVGPLALATPEGREGKWPRDVPDPYYGGAAGFEFVLDMIEAACPAILTRLRAEFEQP